MEYSEALAFLNGPLRSREYGAIGPMISVGETYGLV